MGMPRQAYLCVRTQVPFDAEAGDPGWRVRRHFDDVLRRLAHRDVSGLTPRARTARVHTLDRLRAYAERGAFPQNEDFPGLLVPHFIDRAGTTCAVAQLLIDSGHVAMAEHIAATQNLLAVDAMSAEGLDEWIAESGLSPAECAMVQPGYCCGHGPGRAFEYYEEDVVPPADAGDGGGDEGNLGFGGWSAGESSSAAGGGVATGGVGGSTGGSGGAGGAGGAIGTGGAGSGGMGGHAAIERQQGVSAVALVSSRRPRAMPLQSPALATLSLGFLALIVRRNKGIPSRKVK